MTDTLTFDAALHAPGIITVDLGAIAANWRSADAASGAARAGAVVKADAYGLGIDRVVPALSAAGCSTFFVALATEGVAVRQQAPDAEIYVLNGPMFQNREDGSSPFLTHDLIPVLNDTGQIDLWSDLAATHGKRLPAAIMLDTGMKRLGLDEAELESVVHAKKLAQLDIRQVMSHLACADDPTSQMSIIQRTLFNKMRSWLPEAPASLANSAGIFLGDEYHYDVTRPGICLYGGSPFVDAPAPFRPVVSVQVQVIQTRNVAAGETIGYGATFTAPSDMRTATLAAGYADGIFRAAGNHAEAAINGVRVPYVGRVSMDLLALDISALGQHSVQPGDMVELVGSTISVDDLAHASGTIGYEVLTSLGARYERRYIEGKSSF